MLYELGIIHCFSKKNNQVNWYLIPSMGWKGIMEMTIFTLILYTMYLYSWYINNSSSIDHSQWLLIKIEFYTEMEKFEMTSSVRYIDLKSSLYVLTVFKNLLIDYICWKSVSYIRERTLFWNLEVEHPLKSSGTYWSLKYVKY